MWGFSEVKIWNYEDKICKKIWIEVWNFLEVKIWKNL